MKKWLLAPALLIGACAIAVPSAFGSGGAPKAEKVTKAGREAPAVLRDIQEGKAKKVKSEKHTTGVWDGCKFHYLKTDESVYVFDDDSEAHVSENPDPLPPPTCTATRQPTRAEMDAMEAKVDAMNPKPVQVPGGPPPLPRPAERFRGTP